MEPLDVPPGWHWREEIGAQPEDLEKRWEAPELPLDDGRTLVLDADPLPPEDVPVFFMN